MNKKMTSPVAERILPGASHGDSSPRNAPVIVVGGGLTGIATATYLAQGGTPVTLLEKSTAWGGRAITDVEQGYALNRGAHALYTGGPASAVLHELGVRYSSGVPRRLTALDARGLHAFPATAASLLRTMLFDVADKRDLMSLFLRLSTVDAARLGHTDVAAWIDSVSRRPKVRQLLRAMATVYMYSSALEIISADAFVSRLQQTMRSPVHYIDSGWQTLVDELRHLATTAGVSMHAGASVASMQFDDGSARSVRLFDGNELRCSGVVLAVPPDEATRLSGAAGASSGVTSIVAAHIACLDVALERLPNPRCPVVFDLEQPRFMTVQSEFARLTPDGGGAVVHVMKQLDPRHPAQPHVDRADMEALLDQVQPGWREVVVTIRFLPRMLGAGALPLAANGGLAGRQQYVSKDVANLYFAGDWVGPRGFLVDASLDSARATARLILARSVNTHQ